MKIEITGIDQLTGKIADLSSRRLRNAVSIAIGKTTIGAQEMLKKEIADSFTGPTPVILNSIKSKIENLGSSIYVDNRMPSAKSNFSPSNVLFPHIFGGGRHFAKSSERTLRALRVMHADQYIVPGPGAPLDEYGNITAQNMQKILSAAKQSLYGKQTARSRGRNAGVMRGVYCVPFVGIFQHTARLGSGEKRWASSFGGPSVPLLFFTKKPPEYEEGRFLFFDTVKSYTRKNFGNTFSAAYKGTMER